MLIIIFSVMLYNYVRITVFETPSQALLIEAKRMVSDERIEGGVLPSAELQSNINVAVQSAASPANAAENLAENPIGAKFVKGKRGDRTYLTLHYPVGDGRTISLETDTTVYSNIVKQILVDILVINATMIFLIMFYAFFLSRTLMMPIRTLSRTLSSFNESVLHHIDESAIPSEFRPLAESINRLIDRIQTFMSHQKELFVGIAHELKTPLAVMKSKNDVTLLRPRESERYIEALRSNNDAIGNMNRMISSVLEIGRQEGAQFEEAVEADIVAFIAEQAGNFAIVARGEGKDIVTRLSPNALNLRFQPSLFMHILQNFAQNAIKFSPAGGVVSICSRLNGGKFIVEVIDEGCGIDESIDLFAPFKRVGDKSGSGLGLFLAKGAASAMNAQISLQNRTDGKTGCVATIVMTVDRGL